MKAILKLKLMLALFLIVGAGMANAQTRYSEWTGQTSGTYTLSHDITLSSTVTLTGNLTIEVEPGTSPTITRTTVTNMFKIPDSDYKLTIHGRENDTIFIDGAAVYTINEFYLPNGEVNPEFDENGPFNLVSFPNVNSEGLAGGNAIWVQKGALDLDYVVIQNCATNDGAICTDNNEVKTEFRMTNCVIRYCHARSSGSAISLVPGFHNAYLENVRVLNCKIVPDWGHGAAIRSTGSTMTQLTMVNCEVAYNWTNRYGGGLAWYGGGHTDASCTIKGNCKFHHNVACNNGGGIYCGAKIDIQSADIYANRATGSQVMLADYLYSYGCGGGIYVYPYTGPSTVYEGQGTLFTMGEGVKVHDNYARDKGGGVYIELVASDWAGFYHIDEPVYDPGSSEYFTIADIKINNGSGIYGNVAEQGAGLCVLDFLPEKHYNTRSHKWSAKFKRSITVNGGEIRDNYAKHILGDNDVFYGGGVFINKLPRLKLMIEVPDDMYAPPSEVVVGPDMDDSHQYDYENGGGAGTDSIYFKGGKIYGNTAKTDGQGYGGGFCVLESFKDGGYDYSSTCDVRIGGTVEIYDNECDKDGGGVFVKYGNVTINGGTVGKENHPNKALGGDGGGVAVRAGDIVISNGHVDYNQALTVNDNGGYGGAIHLTGGTLTVSGGTISDNHADKDGGGFYVAVPNTTDITTIEGGATIINNDAINGAGAYINQGQLLIQDAATNITSNTATTSGGGIYMANGTVNYTNAKMQTNTATNNDGGGLYLGNGSITISGDDAAISGNMAKNRGGGVYVGGGNFTMSGGFIGGTTAQGNSTTSNASYGGGLYMGDGTATLTGGNISGNTATEGYGGGIYMEGGTCELKGGAKIGGTSTSYANNAKYGGGIYSAGGAITVEGGHIDYNTASADGGGIYSNGPTASVLITKEGSNLSYLQYNTAVNGGGIFANRGSVEFTDGNVNYNYASQAGGGMYVNDEGTLYLKGNAVLSRNHVPTNMKGGGVYLKGTVVVGEASKTETSILAEDNFAFTTDDPENYVFNNKTRNNIYLPEPIANPYTSNIHRDVITVIENGIGADSHVGFSVPRNHVPVIYCERSATSWDYLDRFTTGPYHDLNTRLFDDTEHYLSVHYTGWPEAFDPDHVYLYGFWTEAVRSLDDVPDNGFVENGNTVTINNKEGLAWLISYVNGQNGSDPHTSTDLVVNLEADVDMSEFGWVPIGFKGITGVTPKPFNGTFNGNGHLITGVNGMVYGQGENGVVDYGLFGYVTGGLVQDVFVHGMEYYTDQNGSLVLGGLVGENDGGVLCNSEVQAKLISQSAETLIGGLVGKQVSGVLHSSIGVADMTGGRMGGLVGENNGDLYNSFANSQFTSKDNSKYAGGLVAINNWTVENCYVRLRGNAPGGNFGMFAGYNGEDGLIEYCYAPPRVGSLANVQPVAPNSQNGLLRGYGNYGDSQLPYRYCHRDTQISLTESNNGYVPEDDNADKQMLVVLNNWVNEMSTEDMTYTKWGRPWHETNELKPLNDDYPILRMPSADAVAAQVGDPYLYFRPIDTLLASYTAADEAIWMYRNNANVTGTNVGSEAKLYIAEEVALINYDTINAFVGITLDNSAGENGANPQGGVSSTVGITTDATDWHIISTSLSNAPIGINYSDETTYPFSYGHPSGMPYYLFYRKLDPKHGYFPDYKFGVWEYPSTDTTIVDGNYYTEWDFYSYDEPQYHWINFKRNKFSHWHIDDPEHDWQITYENESRMTPGKGYFAATREETFLQCKGTLNHGGVDYNLTQTPGVPRHGYNLIGNPYQAYLDFNAFVTANVGDEQAIWDVPSTASYTVMDEDSQDYVTFAYNASDNPAYAGRYIHPHQGFFVLLRDRNAAKAFFEPIMRNATAEDVKFRSEPRINYPLVNLYVKEASGNGDRVTVELGRPDNGGAPLMKGLRTGNGKIWCRYNDEDWAIAYTQPGTNEVSIRFESVEDTEYTLRWDTQNGEFSYLHLIDNMTGADVDCLSESEYKFSSHTSDYASRFRLMFGYTGIEEDTEAETEAFAFMMGDELVVNGEGVLQVFDMNGRLVTSRELHGTQSTVMLPGIANGVYMMRLTEGKQSRVQKMVISK